MKNFLKKIAVAAMAAVLSVCSIVPAFAATDINNSNDMGTITISGVEEGLNVNAYKIAEAKYDETNVGEFTGYEMLYEAGGFSIDQYGNYDEDALTEENLAALFTEASKNAVTATATADVDGNATFTLPVGSYLFVVTGSESTVYSMVIGSVSYDADANGNWIIKEGSVNVKDNENLWVKASDAPTVTKEEKGGSLDDYGHGGSANVGDTLEYRITVGPIPKYEGEYPKFQVTDNIDSKLQITEEELDALTVTIGDVPLSKDVNYTVEATADGFIIDFVVNGKYTLNQYVGQNLVIDYFADVVDAGDADADDADHKNDAVLTFATTSYITGNDGQDKDTVHDYTFNAKIQKVDGNKQALANAEFTLFTDEECSNAYTQNKMDIKATSSEDGYFEFTGLEEGTYYMKETKTPAGYALNTNIYKVEIKASYDENGELEEGYTVTVTDITNNENVGSAVVTSTNAKITNTKVGTLPSMGGKGTVMMIIFAAIICAAGAGLYSRNKAKHIEE